VGQDGNGAAARQDTRGDWVFDRVLGLILEGELAPGAVVNESALALRFGVSRGPVREAIRRLQGIQLVTREAFQRARVLTLSPEALVDLFQIREALEGYACRLAAARLSEAEIGAILRDLERAADRTGNPASRFDFHERIVRASGNKRIISALCGDLYYLIRIYRRLSGTLGHRHESALQEHWQIARALNARDGLLAESLMRAHIERAGRHLAGRLEPSADSAGRLMSGDEPVGGAPT
jgi:DNA-binding GntR family transcriptional regulator